MDYAIFETGNKQYKVKAGDTVDIELFEAKPEESLSFDKVLLVNREGKFEVGKPYIKGAKVTAKVIEIGKDSKVTTFKFKNKINYHRTKGHRQPYIRIRIEEIKSK